MNSPTPNHHPNDPVIISIIRTPLCSTRKGSLSTYPPSTLLQHIFSHILSTTAPTLPPTLIEDICIGNVLSPQSFAVSARMAALSAGIPHTTSISTINRQCSSGLQAVANIANSIRCGNIEVGIGAGVESMSMNSMMNMPVPEVDWESMTQEAKDCLIPMGVTSENVTQKFGLTREELDAFAAHSHKKASIAQRKGTFREEIVPIGDITDDDGIRPNTTIAKLSKLKPVFDKQKGSTTAGNSSQITDGAAAVLLMSRRQAQKLKLPILGVWRGFATIGVPPKIMGIGPAFAIPKVLHQVGLTIKDVDVFEINEAFASQALWCVRELGIEEEKVNVNGGAIALGHPLGCTGARCVVSILKEMKRSGKRWGVVSMCIGTGMGAAAVLEVEDDFDDSVVGRSKL